MDLQILASRTQLPQRKLRYVIDHDLVPGLKLEIAENEVGRPRRFADDAGFGIACAASLLEAGLHRAAVRQFLETLLGFATPRPLTGRDILIAVLQRELPAVAELGDGVNIRIRVDDPKFDSGWMQPRTNAKLAKDYEPNALVRLNLRHICDKVVGKK